MAYNLKHTSGFYDIGGHLWTVEIYGFNYDGSDSIIPKMGGTPLTIDYGKSSNMPHDATIQDTRLSFSLQGGALLELSYLFSQNKKQNKVIVKLEGNVFFAGFVVGDTYSEPYKPAPFFVSFNAADGLLLLKDRVWETNDRLTPLSIITRCLAETSLDLNFKIALATTVLEPVVETNPLANLYYNTDFYTTEKYTYLEVLEDVLKAFGLVIKQVGGKWEIVQFSEQAKGSYTWKEYDAAGALVTTGTNSPVINVSGTGVGSTAALLTSSYININPAYKRFKITQLLGSKGSIVKNYNFDDFTLTGLTGEASFDYWQPRGTIKQYQKDGDNYAVVTGYQAGATPDVNTNYLIQNFGYVKQVSSWANSAGLKLIIDWAILGEFGYTVEGDVYVKIKVGNKSLVVQTPDGQPEGFWVTGDSFIKLGRSLAQSKENIEFQKFELNIAPDPLLSGWTEIRLYAPTNGAAHITGSAFSSIVLKPVDTDGKDVDKDKEIETEVNPNSNYEPGDIEVAVGDVPDFAFADLIYSNILAYSNGTYTTKWKFTTAGGLEIEDTLLTVLAGQISDMFLQNKLMLQANIVSDILRFNSLLTDTTRLGSRIFALMRATFDCKHLLWSNAELLEIGGNGDIEPDFLTDDHNDFDFFTGE